MHLEIQLALNYLATHLYNKLPRRRINLFTELLTITLKQKFLNHWYPQSPEKGSAFRCLKTTDPLLKLAAIESNLNYNDIIDNLPKDLCIWIDPGEVSYRVVEGGQSVVLWRGITAAGVGVGGANPVTTVAATTTGINGSGLLNNDDDSGQGGTGFENNSNNIDGFLLESNNAGSNPAAMIDDMEIMRFLWKSSINNSDNNNGIMNVGNNSSNNAAVGGGGYLFDEFKDGNNGTQQIITPPIITTATTLPIATAATTTTQQQLIQQIALQTTQPPTTMSTKPQQQLKKHPLHNHQPQLMTTAAFAQTKFGSTKLKTNTQSTRSRGNSSGLQQRMSPTEFSNYIKQKQLLQEQQAAAAAAAQAAAAMDYYYYDGGYWGNNGTIGYNNDFQTVAMVTGGNTNVGQQSVVAN